MNKQSKYIVNNSFIVNDTIIDDNKAMTMCNMLSAITELNDEMLIMLFGTMDFDKIIVRHFELDILGKAMLNDWVNLHSYVHTHSDDGVEVKVVAKRVSGSKTDVLVNGSFVFAAKRGVQVQYSLS